MKYYGTKNDKDYGFYEEPFENAIEITDNYWASLLLLQNEGRIIIPFEGKVIAVNDEEYSIENGVWKKLSEPEVKTKQLKIQNAIRIDEIKNELSQLDRKRIRALAEPSLKDESTTWLEYYNSKISELRKEMEKIS